MTLETMFAMLASGFGTSLALFALTLLGAPAPESDGIRGWYFPYGQYGVQAKRGGGFYIAEPAQIDGEEAANVYIYQFDPQTGFTRNGGKN